MAHGSLTISLDFELHWGLRDVVPLEACRERLLRVRDVVPRLLEVFAAHDVHATWATVGFLLCESKDELLAAMPDVRVRPRYGDAKLDPYRALDEVGADERSDPFHFAPSLVRAIAKAPGQELGTHTFSHFYCLESGQDVETFAADLSAAARAAERLGVPRPRSLVFPRNQFNDRYLAACAANGIVAYRGNPRSWMYDARDQDERRVLRRGARLVDTYVNVSRLRGYVPPARREALPLNVPATRFLRPWTRQLAMLHPLALRRVEREMEAAARRRELYHLWWHPHNFGADMGQNFAALGQVLRTFRRLRDEHGFESLSMAEVADRWMAREAVA